MVESIRRSDNQSEFEIELKKLKTTLFLQKFDATWNEPAIEPRKIYVTSLHRPFVQSGPGGRAGSGLPSLVVAVSGVLDGGLAENVGQMSGHSLGIGGPAGRKCPEIGSGILVICRGSGHTYATLRRAPCLRLQPATPCRRSRRTRL